MAVIKGGNCISLASVVQHYIYVAIEEDATPLAPHDPIGDKQSQGTYGILQQGF